MVAKMQRKPSICYGLLHMKALFMVSARFLFDNFFLVSLERNDVFLYNNCYYKYTATHADDNMTYL